MSYYTPSESNPRTRIRISDMTRKGGSWEGDKSSHTLQDRIEIVRRAAAVGVKIGEIYTYGGVRGKVTEIKLTSPTEASIILEGFEFVKDGEGKIVKEDNGQNKTEKTVTMNVQLRQIEQEHGVKSPDRSPQIPTGR